MPVTSDELAVALEEALGTAVELVERRPGSYGSSFAIEELDVLTAAGERRALVFKNVGPDGLSVEARAAKPEFLYEPTREIDVYRHVLAPYPSDAPRFHGALVDPEQGRYWLFIERVDGAPMHEIGDRETWREAARWLARFHNRSGTLPASAIRYDECYYGRWRDRATSVDALGRDGRLERAYEQATARLLQGRQVFIHGEFYASNVLVGTRADGSLRIAPVDWELAAWGPEVADLAALTSGKWSDDERTDFALAYLDAGTHRRNKSRFLEELECARLHLAVQWLGWSQSWTPPAQHRQDWLAEAIRAAERLGL
jgi:aminoglycoside phosphotransferase (APT) family kinase protein